MSWWQSSRGIAQLAGQAIYRTSTRRLRSVSRHALEWRTSKHTWSGENRTKHEKLENRQEERNLSERRKNHGRACTSIHASQMVSSNWVHPSLNGKDGPRLRDNSQNCVHQNLHDSHGKNSEYSCLHTIRSCQTRSHGFFEIRCSWRAISDNKKPRDTRYGARHRWPLITTWNIALNDPFCWSIPTNVTLVNTEFIEKGQKFQDAR